MNRNEYIELRVVELEARRAYANQLVMNRDMQHETKMCDVQIAALLKERDLQVLNVTPAAIPHSRLWHDGIVLMHTDDDGNDTVLCQNHLNDRLTACSNCGAWPEKL